MPSQARSHRHYPSDVEIEIIGDDRRLAEVAGEWDVLHSTHRKSHQLFQSHAWIATWARYFTGTSSTSLAITVVRCNGEAVLIWPLAVHRVLAVRRQVWAGGPVSQYGDVIAAPIPDLADVIARSWQRILEELRPDVVHLRKVRTDSTVAAFLAKTGAVRSGEEEAPFLDLGTGATYTEYEQRYSAKSRKNRRRLLRRLEEQGAVAFTHAGPGPEAQALAVRAIDFKLAWLAQRGLVSPALDDQRTTRFFAHICSVANAQANPLVSALTLDGQPCAIMVAIAGGDRICGHIFAYDLAFEKAGAGALLLEDCLRHACSSGHRYFDLLAPADAYKLDWSNASAGVADWTMSVTVRGSLFARMHQLVRSQWRNLKASRSLAWAARASALQST